MASLLSPFFLRDLEAPGAVSAVGKEHASAAGDIVLLATGPDVKSIQMAKNTMRMLRGLSLLPHTVLLADSIETCNSIGYSGCYWSSRIILNPPSASVTLTKFWDWRFKFYYIKKKLMARFVGAGYGVLQCDTDTVWQFNPFPALRSMPSSVVLQYDRPFANAGIMYARPGDAASMLLNELAYRIQLVQNRPDDAVPRIVSFAKKAPFYGNTDDQTALNDVILSLALGNRSFLGSLARFEASNRYKPSGPEWHAIEESRLHIEQIRKTQSLFKMSSVVLPWVPNTRHKYSCVPVAGTSDSVAIAPPMLFGHLPVKPKTGIAHLAGVSGFSAKTAHLKRIGAWNPDINGTWTPPTGERQAAPQNAEKHSGKRPARKRGKGNNHQLPS
uniref:Nucleotide-diphospho-sugar transferase domain-containing protein n=1 Tax=Chrysotila carterae TaxID=13221 RepID=A0A7S4B2Q7_CHRCT